MNRDEILKQGKDLAGKLRDGAGDQVARNEQTIKGTLGKLAGFVNSRTGGKYSDKVDKATGLVEQGMGKLTEGKHPAESSGTESPGTAAADGTPPPSVPPSVPGRPTNVESPTGSDEPPKQP